MSAVDISAYESDVDVFESVGAYFRQPEDRFAADGLVRFVSVPVTRAFFGVLGVKPAIGRTFLPEDTSESHLLVT